MEGDKGGVLTKSPPSRVTSNASRNGCFKSWPTTTPLPIPPSSLQMRVRGGGFSFHPPHHCPFLPRFKCKLEEAVLVSTHLTTHSPSLASNVSWRGQKSWPTIPHHRSFPLPHFKCMSVPVVFPSTETWLIEHNCTFSIVLLPVML